MSAKVADSNLVNLSGDLMQKKKVDLHLNANLSKVFGHESHSVTGHVEDNTSCEVGEEVVEGNPAEIGEEALPEEEVGLGIPLVEKLGELLKLVLLMLIVLYFLGPICPFFP